jgi:hypothetical protein
MSINWLCPANFHFPSLFRLPATQSKGVNHPNEKVNDFCFVSLQQKKTNNNNWCHCVPCQSRSRGNLTVASIPAQMATPPTKSGKKGEENLYACCTTCLRSRSINLRVLQFGDYFVSFFKIVKIYVSETLSYPTFDAKYKIILSE